MTRVVRLLLLLAGVSLAPRTVGGQQTGSAPRQLPFLQYHEADSVRLERFPGYWGGASYAVVVDRSDHVTVRPDSIARSLFRNPGVKPRAFHDLMAHARIFGFVQLPDTLQTDPVFGRRCGTDAPTAVVTLFHQRLVKQVVDYQGCEWAPAAIRELEREIDEAAGRQPDK
jgi:hypothetical protein